MTPLTTLITLLGVLCTARAASVDDWRTRSVYQILTDRFAPATPNAPCNVADKKYCGGNWQSVIGKLDYIQGMGFDALWISPTALNIENTSYGDAYHGYWPTDNTKLNPHYGSESDLLALVAAVHNRGMYIMFDLVLNHAAGLSTDISTAALAADANGTLLFKETVNYHPACNIQWGNHTSEQICWLSTSQVTLMDLATETAAVADVFNKWVPGYVSKYGIDGFRLDASKHMSKEFQNAFCNAAGVFCMGEIAGDNTQYAASYQGTGGIPGVQGFGLMYGLTSCFVDNPKAMSTLQYFINLGNGAYPDVSATSLFLDNQDLPRYFSLVSDKQVAYNGITAMFLSTGFPTVYYGLEQEMSDGAYDPYNREALWQYNDYSTSTPTYGHIKTLNSIRKLLGSKNSAFWKANSTVLATQTQDIAWTRPGALVVLTNRGSSGTGDWTVKNTGLGNSVKVVDLLSCSTSTTGSDGSLLVTWSTGEPHIFVTEGTLSGSGFCGTTATTAASTTSKASTSVKASTSTKSAATQTGKDLVVTGSGTTSATASATVSSTSSPQPTTYQVSQVKASDIVDAAPSTSLSQSLAVSATKTSAAATTRTSFTSAATSISAEEPMSTPVASQTPATSSIPPQMAVETSAQEDDVAKGAASQTDTASPSASATSSPASPSPTPPDSSTTSAEAEASSASATFTSPIVSSSSSPSSTSASPSIPSANIVSGQNTSTPASSQSSTSQTGSGADATTSPPVGNATGGASARAGRLWTSEALCLVAPILLLL